jgi:asparagine synthase (glutamine-hydrolysing)
MTYAIEARVPFLDHRLVEFAFTLDESFKIENFRNKRIVRHNGRGRVPDAILDRTDKMGFVTPQEVWQRRELSPLLDAAFDEIGRDGLPGAGEGSALAARYRRYKRSGGDWGAIWRLFCLPLAQVGGRRDRPAERAAASTRQQLVGIGPAAVLFRMTRRIRPWPMP